MSYLYPITGIIVLISFITNRAKTIQALKMAGKRLLSILPVFLLMLSLISIILFVLPESLIVRYLGQDNHWVGVGIAAVIGSITILPGFIAFPLCGILLQQGVPYMVLSAFTTTLMMVGVVTFPFEQKYLGAKITIIRNVISFVIALVVAFMTGLFFGELF